MNFDYFLFIIWVSNYVRNPVLLIQYSSDCCIEFGVNILFFIRPSKLVEPFNVFMFFEMLSFLLAVSLKKCKDRVSSL